LDDTLQDHPIPGRAGAAKDHRQRRDELRRVQRPHLHGNLGQNECHVLHRVLLFRRGQHFSASRIYGNDFDVGYAPNAANGVGYYGLTGSSLLHEYVFDINLLYKPSPHFTIVPSVRVDREDWTANQRRSGNPRSRGARALHLRQRRGLTDVRERLDLNYNGVTNWVFYGRGDFTEATGT
jgi:hypothetical protein